MEGYLVLDWPPGTASDQAREMRRDLLGQGWRVAYEEFCILVLVRGERTPPVHVLPGRGGVVLGDVFDTEATAAGEAKAFDLGLLAGLEARDAATVLTRCAWGRYIAVFTKLDAAPSVLRDPLGGIDGVAWRSGPLTLVSDAPPLTGPAAPSGLGIDWARVGDLLADIALVSGPPCLAGVVGIGPGELWDASEDQWIPVWTPARRAWRAGADHPADAAAALRRCAQACVAALAAGRKGIVAEVSGGLDSSLVCLLLREAKAPLAAVTNLHWPHGVGDERLYARAVAERAAMPLTEIARGDLVFDPAALEACAGGLRPPFNAQDAEYDQDMAKRLADLGADALFTGHGGDVVFYQMPQAALARDLVAGAASGEGTARALAQLAQRLRTNVWRLLIEGAGPRGRSPDGLPAPRYLTRRPGKPHPWLADLGGVGGAKRVQIRALVNTLMMRGPSRRGAVADLVDPLLSQPLVELCLALPAPLLAVGDHDRPLARAAFADLLPPVLRERRGKGDVTAVFARSLAASLPVLSPWLLGGRLVGQGLIDPERLARLLDPEVLIWRDHTGEIMRAVIVEAWVRAWERRLADAARPVDQPPDAALAGAS